MIQPMAREIILTPAELYDAALKGITRSMQNIEASTEQMRGAEARSRWPLDIMGCAGERAVAKMLGLPWDGNLGNWHATDVGGFYEVRTRSKHSYELPLYPRNRDKADNPFLLVTTIDLDFRHLYVRGWIWGRDAMQDHFWGNPGGGWTGGSAWLVPPSSLFTLPHLPARPEGVE